MSMHIICQLSLVQDYTCISPSTMVILIKPIDCWMVNDMEISETIRRRREELDLTLLDIAKKVGVSEATIQRYESGKIKNIRQDKIVKLAAALKFTPAELLGWDEEIQTELEENKTGDKRVYKVVRTPSFRSGVKAADTQLTNADDIIALLEKLSSLNTKGVLTDDEYIEKKRDLLSRL